MKYTYFVSFVFQQDDGFGTQTGTGNNVVICGFPIENLDDVKAIQIHLAQKEEPALDRCIITNFILLGKEERKAGEELQGGILN